MKTNYIFIGLLLVLFSFLMSYAQVTSDPIYGNWYQVRKGKIDIRGSKYDLVISPKNKVSFKQTTFKSPCTYLFDGHFENDTIFHQTTLHCLNIETKEQEFKYKTVDSFIIKLATENHLTLVNTKTKEETSYRKR